MPDGVIVYPMDPEESGEYLSGTVASFVCDEGFELFGESTRMCQNNMTWTDSQPSCLSEWNNLLQNLITNTLVNSLLL